MKSFFKKLAFVMALAMVVSLAAPAAQTAVAAEEKELQIAYQTGMAITEVNLAKAGAQEDLRFLNAPENWKDLGATWSSSNDNVVTVDNSGVVTAVAAGSAEVSVAIGTATASVTVYVENTQKYTATMGTADDRNITEWTLEEAGDYIDLAFYGIKDYSRDDISNGTPRYFCEWTSTDETVATVDEKGLVTAVAPGKAKITLVVWNLKLGVKHDVDACWITVPTEEVVAPTETPVVTGIDAKQTTEKVIVVSLEGLKAADYSNKDLWEVYAIAEDKYETIWQVYTATVNADDNTVALLGYDELTDAQYYEVRIVTPDDENGNNETLYEDSLVASVGPVADIDIEWASYLNNQGWWSFPFKAYTNGSDGEEIQTKVSYKLYDDEGIDVTGHYNNAAAGYSIVSFEIINDDDNEVSPYVNMWEDGVTSYMTFDEVLEKPLQLKAVYEDYDNALEKVNTVETTETIVVEKAPQYKVTGIDDWKILNISAWNLSQDIALFDDCDEAGEWWLNHEVVLWFTDNYNNKYVTNGSLGYVNDSYKDITTSPKFTNEGYEIRFASRNPQVLVVGDDETVATNSTKLTTKKMGTARVNVTLHNTVRDDVDNTLVSYMDVLNVTVKAERALSKVTVDNIDLTTDSIPVGAPASKLDTTTTYGAYDTRWTQGAVKVNLYDQYGQVWGAFNPFVLNHTEVDLTTTAAVDTQEITLYRHADGYYTTDKFDGAQLLAQLTANESTASTVKYAVSAKDIAAEVEKKANFVVALKQPTHDGTEIVLNSALKLSADDATYTGLSTTIKVVERSKNGLNVNYADGITLIQSKDEYDAVFNTAGATATEGALYLVVYNPKNAIVETASGSSIGVYEEESGLYTFVVTDTNDGVAASEFTMAGTYKVKLLQVTGTTTTNKVAYKTAYFTSFSVKNDLKSISFNNQEKIYTEGVSSIEELVSDTISFKDLSKTNVWDGVVYDTSATSQLAGVRFRKNSNANSVVVQDVWFKVYIDGDYEASLAGEADANPYTNGYYYVKASVNKTVKTDSIANIASWTSLEAGQVPTP